MDFDWLFGDTYYVQSVSGNVEYNKSFYFEALSSETIFQFSQWSYVFSNWQHSNSIEGFTERFKAATMDAPNNMADAYTYVLRESSKGKLDQKLNLNENTIYIYNNIAMNYQEAGNVIFGAAINQINIDLGIAELGGEFFSWIKNKRPDEYNEVQAYKIGYFNFNSESSFFKNRSTEKFR